MTGYRHEDVAMSDTASSPSDELIDPRPILDRAVGVGATVVAGVEADQLTAPTPCPDMDVRAMLAHLIGVLDRIAALGHGDNPFAITESDAPDDRWAEAWNNAATEAVAAWEDDTLLERPMALPWIEGPGAEILTSYFSELTVHTWDLATATGQQPDWDAAVVDAALGARQILPDENRHALYEEIAAQQGLDEVPVPFADPIPVPDDAPAIDRLVAWNGRDPRR